MMKNTIEPWNIELSERLKKLREGSSKKKVVYVYERADTSTFRYRVYNACQALDFSTSWVGSYFFLNELPTLAKSLKNIDLIIFSRICWSYPLDVFIHQVKRQGIPTVFDIDDLIFNIEKIPLIMNTLGIHFCESSYQYWFSYGSRLCMVGKLCDYTMGTNEFLCNQLRQTFSKPSFISNNFLNREQIEKSEKLFQNKTLNGRASSPFKIGYFSGSPTHKHDFRKIVSELNHLLCDYPQINLEVVGFMEFPDNMQNYIEDKRIVFTPLVNFLTLQEKVSQVDVNVVPLVDNDFTNCKSELKFFEAAIVGTPTCATPTYVFKDNIQHGHTGFLCEEGDWYTAIEKIYKKEINPSLIDNARSYCLKKYSPQNQCSLIEQSLNAILG